MTPDNAAAIAAIAAAVSAVAALVSLGALIFSVWLQWRAHRPHVEVVGVISTLVSTTSVGKPRFGIEVRNVGSLPVVVTSVGVVFGDGELGTLPHARTLLDERVLPKRLDAGEAVSLSNELEPVIEAYREKGISAVWARTAAGRLYRGKTTAKLATFHPAGGMADHQTDS